MHGGGPKVVPGKKLSTEYTEEHTDLVSKGLANLEAHVRVVRGFGIPAVVAINAFPSDTEAEWNIIAEFALKHGAADAVVTRNWADGGEGAADLARAVEKAADLPHDSKPFYPLELPIKEKIERIAKGIYGADRVIYSSEAEAAIKTFSEIGFDNLPICMAKTQYSFSHDPLLKGAPHGFVFPITDVRLAAGAGFIYPISGEISTMPGLPSKPGFMGMDIDPISGKITGLS
jgi:methylenetetrahydrofolate dehydrogenase (NADP+)/methenyltetrahydrofolate cyclohydrolase/formyltetrahydrofolate synthetase/formate--tetrahydrofolate ligase